MDTTYYLISTPNAKIDGWFIFGWGTKEECKKIQIEHESFQGADIYADTLNKNSRIVTERQLKKYGLNFFQL